MTITIREEKINGYLIAIEQEKLATAYKVIKCQYYGNGLAGRPLTINYYKTLEQAKRRFNRLKKNS